MLFYDVFGARCYVQARPMPSCGVRPSVRLCVLLCHVREFCQNEIIEQTFSPSSSQTILVFAYQTVWRYFDRDLLNGGVECGHKSRFSTNSWRSIDDCCSATANNNCDRPPRSLPHRPPHISESMFINNRHV